MNGLMHRSNRGILRAARRAYSGSPAALAAPTRLANLEPLKLRMPETQRLVVPCPTMRGTERLGFGPCLEHGPVFLRQYGMRRAYDPQPRDL
jgi:hypothetical protein